MLYGIKYEYNKKNSSVDETYSNLGSNFFIIGKSEFVFDNLLSALVVSRALNKSHNNLKYNVYKLKPWQEKLIPKENIVSSADEFKRRVDEKSQKVNEKSEQIK